MRMRDRDRLEGLFQTEKVPHQSRIDCRGAVPDIRPASRLEDERYNGMSSRKLTSCSGSDPRVWLIPTGGSTLMLEIRTSSSSRTMLTVRDGPSSARLVHACPLAGTNCLGSSQMGPGRHSQHAAQRRHGRPAGESGCELRLQVGVGPGYCVPQALHIGSSASSCNTSRAWEGTLPCESSWSWVVIVRLLCPQCYGCQPQGQVATGLL